MSALEVAVRLILVLSRNPHVQALAKHAVRTAAAAVIRQARHRSRGSVDVTHIS